MDNGEFYKNLLIFSVYLLSVAYIFSKIASDLQEFISLKFDQDFLDEQLKAQNLQDCLGIKFSLQDLYKPEQVRDLEITIENKSVGQSLYVDWEQSTLTNLSGESRRLIRLVPGMNVDLSQSQVCGIVAPTQTLTEQVVAEESLRNTGEGKLEVICPLFQAGKLQAAARTGAPFTLRLILELADPTVGKRGGSLHALNCNFFVSKTPLRRTIPW